MEGFGWALDMLQHALRVPDVAEMGGGAEGAGGVRAQMVAGWDHVEVLREERDWMGEEDLSLYQELTRKRVRLGQYGTRRQRLRSLQAVTSSSALLTAVPSADFFTVGGDAYAFAMRARAGLPCLVGNRPGQPGGTCLYL